MNRKFDFKIKLIFFLSCLLTVIVPILVFVISKNIYALVTVFTGMILMLGLLLILHVSEDKYISDIVSEVSRLIEMLNELEEKEIFPENEDNALSKLQTNVIKLVRILKKKNQQSEKDSENIKSLVSDISHQLKTPISNLKMYSEFLTDSSLSENKRKEYVDIIIQSVERLSFLSESMIKLSRLESGLIHLNMRNQSLNETVLKAVKDIYPKAKSKNTEIIYSEDNNIVINHDNHWTAEAIFNLLDNAVKYSKSGAKIHLSVKQYGMFSAVEVKDENEPIPENEQAKIFTRFYRGSNSYGKEGVGIGLYLVREIAIRQGGYVKFSSLKFGNSFAIVLKSNS